MIRNGGVNLTKNFSVKNAWLVCVGLNFSACGEFASAKCYKLDLRHLLQGIYPANVAKGWTQRLPKIRPQRNPRQSRASLHKRHKRIEKERREFSNANLWALSAEQNGANSKNGEFSRQNSILPRTNDESGISWGEVFKLIADLATIAKFALKF